MLEDNSPFDFGHHHGIRSILHIRFRIQQFEDAFRAGDGRLQVRPQLRNLQNGLVEALYTR